MQSVSALLLSKCHRFTEEGICKLNCCCCFHMRSKARSVGYSHSQASEETGGSLLLFFIHGRCVEGRSVAQLDTGVSDIVAGL